MELGSSGPHIRVKTLYLLRVQILKYWLNSNMGRVRIWGSTCNPRADLTRLSLLPLSPVGRENRPFGTRRRGVARIKPLAKRWEQDVQSIFACLETYKRVANNCWLFYWSWVESFLSRTRLWQVLCLVFWVSIPGMPVNRQMVKRVSYTILHLFFLNGS